MKREEESIEPVGEKTRRKDGWRKHREAEIGADR
jgi:hypothetical protein